MWRATAIRSVCARLRAVCARRTAALHGRGWAALWAGLYVVLHQAAGQDTAEDAGRWAGETCPNQGAGPPTAPRHVVYSKYMLRILETSPRVLRSRPNAAVLLPPTGQRFPTSPLEAEIAGPSLSSRIFPAAGSNDGRRSSTRKKETHREGRRGREPLVRINTAPPPPPLPPPPTPTICTALSTLVLFPLELDKPVLYILHTLQSFRVPVELPRCGWQGKRSSASCWWC
jgi:hypothetical protein